ncbi:MAG TPA: hypothetical protein VH158_09175 [Gemmatimonadales bacterium]|nr:hypothetical protein [Gemmatimonadales bacterium]
MTRLDEFAPVWQFREVHTIAVGAPPAATYPAIKMVTASEIRFFRVLTWVRRLGRRGPPSTLNAPADLPLLGVATGSGFLLLADEPNREVVVGIVLIAPRAARRSVTPVEFRAVNGRGYAKAAMNFWIEPVGRARCVVTTETRVWAADAPTRWRFRLYWWVIRPGSGLIRRMWLRAIRQRAERVAPVDGRCDAH